MTALAHVLSLALLHFVWQGTLAAMLLWIALFLMRKWSANARYALSCAALAAMVLAPAFTIYVLYQGPVLQQVWPAESRLGAGLPAPPAPTHGSDWLSALQAWAAPVWCLGVVVFSARLVWGSRQVSLMRRRGEQAEERLLRVIARLAERMGLCRRVDVLTTALADGPSVVGLIRPVILLPASTILGLTPEQLEAVLAHELAHIRRYDYLVNVLQMLAEALLFYHPAIWWTSARIRRERELCCDDEAVRVCGDSFCYARALTALERIRAAAPTLALGSNDGPLAYRIKRLMGIVADENVPSKLPGLIALGLALACLGVSVNRVRAQAKPDASGVRVDLGSSAVVHRAPVEYPDAAQIKNIKGTVSVEVHLDQSGNVSDARVLSGPEELRKPVLQSVLGWHFTPDAAGSTRVVNIEFQPSPDEKPKAVAAAAPWVADSNTRPDVERTTEFLRAELDQMKANLQAQAQVEANQDAVQGREAEVRASAQLAELKAKLARAEAQMRDAQVREWKGSIPESFQGRTLSTIRLVGLGISKEDFLAQAQLPIREGEMLTRESAEAAAAAVKKFDEHLSLLWSVRADGGLEMTIAAPGTSGGGGGRGATKGSKVTFPEGFQKASGTFGTLPIAVHQPAPDYTEEARRAKWQGLVTLSFVVDEAGHATNIQITRPLGMGLDDKAVEALKKWQFKPGTIDGRPKAKPVNAEVNFRLQ